MRPVRFLDSGFRRPAAAACVLLALHAAAAGGRQIDAGVLKKVKAATVQLRVTLSDARVAQGSGFFTDEPGLVVTNAHVLQMLAPDSRKPVRIDVTLDGGTPAARTLPGKVVGVDAGSDLALVRVEGKNLPAPLTFGATAGLTETQTLYVFGYPFGRQLGDAITVAKSSVSSLRRAGENIVSVQLDGGLNPGNSGGPVVDAAGTVFGVAVSGVRGTGIGSAIPAEVVDRFVNGRLSATSAGVPYKVGDAVMTDMTFTLIDPLGRLKAVEFQLWAGDLGPDRPAAAAEPPAAANDSGMKRYVMPYAKKPTVTLAVPLPGAGAGQVYWVRPVVTTGSGVTRWVSATSIPKKPPLDRRPVTLKYRPAADRQTAEVITNGDFRIRLGDGDETAVRIDTTVGVAETAGEETPGAVPFRLAYTSFGMTVRVDGKPVDRSPDVRKTQTDIRFAAADVDMDKDGGLAAAKADLAGVPRASRELVAELSDQFLQSLEIMSVPLPEKEIGPKDTWKGQRSVLMGVGVVSIPVQTDLTYRYMGVQERAGKAGALIYIDGRVKGRKGDELDVGGTVKGDAFVSLETGQVLSANTTIKADVDLAYRGNPTKALATLSVSIRRPDPVRK